MTTPTDDEARAALGSQATREEILAYQQGYDAAVPGSEDEASASPTSGDDQPAPLEDLEVAATPSEPGADTETTPEPAPQEDPATPAEETTPAGDDAPEPPSPQPATPEELAAAQALMEAAGYSVVSGH